MAEFHYNWVRQVQNMIDSSDKSNLRSKKSRTKIYLTRKLAISQVLVYHLLLTSHYPFVYRINFLFFSKPVPAESNLPAWPPVGTNASPHMEFGEEIKLRGSLLEERAHFWNEIYERYYRSPKPPTYTKKRNEL